MAAERAPDAVEPAASGPADPGDDAAAVPGPAADLNPPPRPRPPASTWVAAAVALLAALAMAWATATVGGPLRAECLREAGAATCAARTGWLDDARALQSALALVALALLVLTVLRRARFVRRASLLVVLLAVGSFFTAVLMASGGVPDGLLG